MSDTWYLRVDPSRAHAYERLGRKDCGPSAGHHGEHSRLMRFESVEEPPIPIEEGVA